MIRQIIVKNRHDNTQAQVYKIDKKLSLGDCQKIGRSLINSVTQGFEIGKLRLPKKSGWFAEISFLPGVTDNVGTTVQEIIEDLLEIKFKAGEKVYTSQIFFSKKKLAESPISPLIQKMTVNQLQPAPKVRLVGKNKVMKVNLQGSDKKLQILGKLGIRNRGPLALDLTELKTIKEYFKKEKRQPTDIELEAIAQTWSEHCQHKIFRNLFNRYIKAATEKINKRFCASVFKDNSGAIEFDQDWLVTHKVETHNSPSALDPFGGAITGIVGVNRDALGFGLGAKPIVNTYGFCLADPADKKPLFRDKKLTKPMLSPRQIFDGVVRGVNSGGNCSGIPTPLGWLYFDDSYRGKPLVFVGTVGLIPKKSLGKKAKAGDYIVMVGGRVGVDGIHGATFSSQGLHSDSPVSAVQIGDPITQKKLSDVLVKEARDLNLYTSITDNGAGGLSCSVAEMAKESGGFVVDLEKVPLKYPGLKPWQIWISESQERMTLAVPPKKWPRLRALLEKKGVEATMIGWFTDSGRAIVKFKAKKIMDLSLNWLHHGWPKQKRKMVIKKKVWSLPKLNLKNNLNEVLLKILGQLNIRSFESVTQQYDHEVQGGSVLKPLQGAGKVNAEAVISRPVLTSNKGIVLTYGINPNLSLRDTYQMAAAAIDTAIRNAVAAGANFNKIALLDNFCWPSANEPERLGELKLAAQACYDYAIIYQTPFISGKDSLFNDFNGFGTKGQPVKISVLPTLLISAIGIIEDINKAVSLDVKFPDDLVYILGANQEMTVNALTSKKLYQALGRAINQQLVVSSISVTKGGLGIALAKMAMAGILGLKVSLNCSGERLFSESSGRLVVTINPKNKIKFEKIMAGNAFYLAGKVTKKQNILINNFINLSLSEALNAYKS